MHRPSRLTPEELAQRTHDDAYHWLNEANHLLGRMEPLIARSQHSSSIRLGRYAVDTDMDLPQLKAALLEGPNPAEISDAYNDIRGAYDSYPLTRAAFEHAVDRAASTLDIRGDHLKRQREWRTENAKTASAER